VVQLGDIAEVGLESGTDQLNAVAQIVCTLTARPGIGQVQFHLNNRLPKFSEEISLPPPGPCRATATRSSYHPAPS